MTTLGAIILALIKRESRQVKLKTNETADKVEHINKAVNNVAEGEPTLIQRVSEMKQEQDTIKKELIVYQCKNKEYQLWVIESLQTVGRQLGVKIKDHESY